MHQIRHGSVSQPDLDNRFMKTELEEAAQLDTLQVLGNAIRQHRGLLEQQHDYVAKIELMIPMRRCNARPSLRGPHLDYPYLDQNYLYLD